MPHLKIFVITPLHSIKFLRQVERSVGGRNFDRTGVQPTLRKKKLKWSSPSSRGKTPNTISRFLRKMEWFGFFVDIGFLVWERGHSTVNSQCFLTMRPMIFWNLISISFTRSSFLFKNQKDKNLTVKSKEYKISNMNS